MTRDYFSMAAHIWYLLRPDTEGARLMVKVRKFTDAVMREPCIEDPVAFLDGYTSRHRDVFDAAMKGEIDQSRLQIYFTLFRALDVLCESDELRRRAEYTAGPLNREFRDETEIYLTYPDNVYRRGNANDSCAMLFSDMIFFLKRSDFFRSCSVRNFYFGHGRLGKDGEFDLGFIPYPAGEKFAFEDTKDGLFAPPRAPNELDELFYKRFEYAVTEAHCDVVFGPEMCGSPDLDKKLRGLCAEDGAKILFCPSYHSRDGTGAVSNRATVYARVRGHTERDCYIKRFPARIGRAVEALAEPERYNLFVFHIQGFGRIGFFVCRDYLTPDARQLVMTFNLDLVLVSCYTEKTSDFLTDMLTDGGKNRTVILGNACNVQTAARGEGVKPVQYVLYRKDHGLREQNCKLYGETCNETRCNDVCIRVFRVGGAGEIAMRQEGASCKPNDL